MSGSQHLVLYWILLCASSSAVSQRSTADSLQQILKTSKDETKVDVLNQLTYEFITVDNEKVESYSNQAIKLSKEIGYKKGEAVAYTYKGVGATFTTPTVRFAIPPAWCPVR